MARSINRLSALGVARLALPGLHHDGGGLYLQVGASGSKSWTYRYMLAGRAREMGLGPLQVVSLAEAREKAAEARRLKFAGTDPIAARSSAVLKSRIGLQPSRTFMDCARQYIESHRPEWKNDKHGTQWQATLDTYVGPVFGDMSVRDVDLGLVMRVLEPIWRTKTETASRLRGRIERILDWATTAGYRQGENPARWRGHLENLLAKRSKVRKVKHHPALPYTEVAAFLSELRDLDGIAPQAFEFLILTAARTSEVLGARWGEFDLENAIWTVPASRIKAGREHRVPLSQPVMRILTKMAGVRQGELVFQGPKKGKPLSSMALLAVLDRMGRRDITAHGFRSTFRDWAAERTNFPRDVAEMALAHAIADKVEAAYRRGDLFEKRRKLMYAWAKHCEAPATKGDVLEFGASGSATISTHRQKWRSTSRGILAAQ
jgi:integrase